LNETTQAVPDNHLHTSPKSSLFLRHPRKANPNSSLLQRHPREGGDLLGRKPRFPPTQKRGISTKKSPQTHPRPPILFFLLFLHVKTTTPTTPKKRPQKSTNNKQNNPSQFFPNLL
jgi:hypothetical protein